MTDPAYQANEKLRVFISSTMDEFRDVRELIEKTLTERGLNAFVYEASGARPHSATKSSLLEVERSDVYVGLFGVRFGDVTAQEFQRARDLKKPCFVYVRGKDIQRDESLQYWLQKHIFDPVSGVSHSYFDRSVELAQQVADDIMVWLVARYRELTAVVLESELSATENAKLQAEADQLQKLTTLSLPYGDAVDLLAGQMRAWFGALSYGFEGHQLREKNYFEWIIRVPKRRGFDRILVQGVEGEAGIGHINTLEQAVKRNGTDEGWLVAMRRVSPAARLELEKRENQNLVCYTFDELLDENANFDAYLDWLDREVKHRTIDSMYIPLACTKAEFDPKTGLKIGESPYTKRMGGIDRYIDQWLADPSKEHVSVLGEFGTGKTWFALHYAWISMRRYREAKSQGVTRPRVPLVISLRDYAKAVSVESLFSEFFFRKYEIPLPNYSAFEVLNRMGKLLLIFDGFDEMADRVDRQKMINNFWELSRVVVPGAKAILTCRTEHFPDAREGRALLNSELQASVANLSGQPPQFETLELTHFDDSQIIEVLSKRTDDSTIQVIRENPQLFDLARRPLMTELIVEAIPDIEKGKPVDLSRVYLYAVRTKMERDITEERTFTSLADKLFFLCELSWQMLSTSQTNLNYRLFPATLRRLFGPIVEEQKDLDHWHYDMLGQTLLIRNAAGDYAPAHRSLLEFFVAYKFAAELGLLAPDFTDVARARSKQDLNLEATPKTYTWSTYFERESSGNGGIKAIAPLKRFKVEGTEILSRTVGHEPLSKAALDLLQNMIVETGEETSALKNIIALTKGKATEDVGCLGGNAATLLVRKRPEALKGQNVVFANLNHANFSNADLSDCNLRGANLSNSIFANTKLQNANLRHSELFEAHFMGASEAADVAFGHDGSIVAVGGSDGFVHIWDAATQRELRTLGGHKSRIRKVVYDRFGRLLATLSSERVQFWDVNTYNLEATIFAYEHSLSDLKTICFNPKRWGQFTIGAANGLVTIDRSQGTEVRWDISHPSDNICYTVTGNRLVIAETDATIGVYDLETRIPKCLLANRHGRCLDLDIADDERRIAALWLDDHADKASLIRGALEVYQVDSDASDSSFESYGLNETLSVAHAPYVSTATSPIKILAGGNLVAIAGTNADVQIRDMSSGNVVMKFSGHISPVTSLSLSQDRTKLASGSLDGTVKVWDSRPTILLDGMASASPVTNTRTSGAEKLNDPAVWWNNYRLTVPTGSIHNESFGECLQSIEQKLDYKGLQLNGAKGLETVVIADDGYTTLGTWLVKRGASLE